MVNGEWWPTGHNDHNPIRQPRVRRYYGTEPLETTESGKFASSKSCIYVDDAEKAHVLRKQEGATSAGKSCEKRAKYPAMMESAHGLNAPTESRLAQAAVPCPKAGGLSCTHDESATIGNLA